MKSAPIILVPGFWLGAWAWDEVAGLLRADGHDVTAITLPGLESKDADRSSISGSDHVAAICRAIEAADRPVVLAVHSASGFSGYAASDSANPRFRQAIQAQWIYASDRISCHVSVGVCSAGQTDRVRLEVTAHVRVVIPHSVAPQS